jgi:hypothetical protein
MLYLFVDETYPVPKVIVRLSCIAVRQDYFNYHWSKIAQMVRAAPKQPSDHIKLVQDLLTTAEYRTVIADIDMVKALEPLGIPDAIEQKRVISPRADLWSHCFGYSVDYAIRFASSAWAFSLVDIHYDPQALKAEHEVAFKGTLRKALAELFSRDIKVRRIESVSKPKKGEVFTKWQNGTWLANWASQLPHPDKLDGPESNFLYRDLTSIIVKLIQRKGSWFSVAPKPSSHNPAPAPDC